MCFYFQRRRVRHNENYVAHVQIPGCPLCSIRYSVDRAVLVTKTAFLLHNFIRLRDGHFGEHSEIQPHGMADLELPRSSGRASAHDMEIRDAFKDYFISDAGNIPWITAYASVR